MEGLIVSFLTSFLWRLVSSYASDNIFVLCCMTVIIKRRRIMNFVFFGNEQALAQWIDIHIKGENSKV